MKRFLAPVAFLAAVTIAALLVRSALHHNSRQAAPPATTTQTSARHHHRHARHRPHVRTYSVQPGDTFESIAKKNRTTVARLEQLNPGVNPSALQVGQKIRVQ